MTRHALLIAVSLALGPTALAGCKETGVEAQPKPDEPLPPRLERKKPFPELARKLLRDRMAEHKRSMSQLLSAALVLDHERTEAIATELANTPAIPRQVDGTLGPVDQLIRDRFASYQEQMRDRAAELAAAAREHDNSRVARAYGRLTEVCVSCHATYLEAEIEPAEPVPSR